MMRTLLAAAFLAAVGCADAHAQAADMIPARLTLEEALRLARIHNPGFLMTGNDVAVAEATVRSAWGSFLPTVGTSMSVGGGQSHVETYPDPITQKPQQLENPTTSSGSSLGQGVSVNFPLFDYARVKTLAVQKSRVQSAAASIVIQENLLSANVKRLYYTALRSAESIALSNRLLAAAQERLTQTEALYRTANKQQIDLLGARVEIASSRISVQRAQDDATKARLQLAQAIGMRSDGNFELDAVLPPAYDPARVSVDSLVAIALRMNPTVRSRELDVITADKQVSQANASRLPIFSGGLSYNRSVAVPEFGAFTNAYKYLNPKNTNFGFSVGMSLPVFRGFSTSSQILSAKAAAHDSRLLLQQERLQAETSVRVAYIDFLNAFKSLELVQLKMGISNERLALSQDAYRRGTITFAELQRYIDDAANAQTEELTARFSWISALIELEARVGAPVAR